MPTSNEHVDAKTLYEKALDAKINPPQPQPEEEEEPEVDKNEPEIDTTTAENSKEETIEDTTASNTDEPVQDEKLDTNEAIDENDEDQENVEQDDSEKTEQDEAQIPATDGDADLDVKTMKVNELREELAARGLNSKGLKSQLVERLQKALEDEKTNLKTSEESEEAMETTPVCYKLSLFFFTSNQFFLSYFFDQIDFTFPTFYFFCPSITIIF